MWFSFVTSWHVCCDQLLRVTPRTPTRRLLCPWGLPGNPTGRRSPGVAWHLPPQGISPTQEPSPHLLCLLHCRQILCCCAVAEALLTFWQSNSAQEGILGMDGRCVHLAVALKCQTHKQSFGVELLDRDLSIHVLNECCSGQSARWLT